MPDAVDDVGTLYTTLSQRLEKIVRLDVGDAEPVVEDACQIAWSRLVDHRHRVRRDAALGWLATTAVREAVRLIRRDEREPSLDAILEEAGDSAALGTVPAPEESLEQVALLELLADLPLRQRRITWLHAVGLSYVEIADHERCTRRTVERQLLRAKRSLRAAAAS